MKKLSTSQPSVLSVLFKSMAVAFNSLFATSNNREFKRLKNFIVP